MEFDSLVTSVTTRTDPISKNDLYGHLLTYEQRIETHHFSPNLSLPSVNVAQHNSAPPSFYTGRGKGHSPNYRGRGRGQDNYLGALKSNLLSHVLALMLSTKPLLMPLLKYYGFNLYFVNL
jgi:hypothetical protein